MTEPPQIPHLVFERVLSTSDHWSLLRYRALRDYRHLRADRPYVVRVWEPDGLTDDDRDHVVAYFDARLDQWHSSLLARVLDVLVEPDGRLVVVQECLAGRSFASAYRSSRFTMDQVLSLGVRLSAALTVLHPRHVHRRICPSTVLFDYPPRGSDEQPRGARLAGLDLAHVALSAGLTEWRSPWASPEVRAATSVGDHGDDIYSVAAVVYSALTATEPPLDVAEWPERLRPDAPRSLEGLLRRAMDPDPYVRIGDAGELLDRFRSVERELRLTRTTVGDESWAEPTPRQPMGFSFPTVVLRRPSQPSVERGRPVPAGDPPDGPFPTITAAAAAGPSARPASTGPRGLAIC